jgi:hypothetical protein
MANALSPEFTSDRVRIGEGQALLRRGLVGHSGESSRVDRSKLNSLGRPGGNGAIPARSSRETHIH